MSDDPAAMVGIIGDLRRHGCTTAVARDVESAIGFASGERPGAVLIHDHAGTPVSAVLSVLKTLRALLPGARVVVVSERASIDVAVRVIRSGADDYLPFPVDAGVLEVVGGTVPTAQGTSMDATPREAMSLRALKWTLIQETLRECGGNITHAARRLCMHRRSLQRVLQRHHVGEAPAGAVG